MGFGKFFQSDRDRRLAFFAGGLFLGAAAGVIYYATKVSTKSYRLERLGISLSPDQAGKNSAGELRILHLSDLHLCEPESHKLDFLAGLDLASFDLVVLTGDIFENYSGLKYADKILSARPRLGAYAVLGNHDCYDYNMLHKTFGRIWRRHRHPKQFRDTRPIVDALESCGFVVLRNTAVNIPEEGLHIVGIDYPTMEDGALEELLRQAPNTHLKIVLQHVPFRLKRLERLGVDLALAGHTHGGQVRVPGIGALITDSELPRHEASGIVWRGKTAIHVSRGLGADPRSNIRLFCPPAATALIVRSSKLSSLGSARDFTKEAGRD